VINKLFNKTIEK